MKNLDQLTNAEKGRLLAALFPEEIENIIEAVLHTCWYLREHEAQARREWKNGFIPFMFWLDLAADAEKAIKKYRYNMVRSSKVFSDQLFYGHIALFTRDCITAYSQSEKTTPKFRAAVTLLFT